MKRRIVIIFFGLFVFVALIVTSCVKDEGKVPEKAPTPLVNCDTISYTKYIKPIVEQKCAIEGCHDGTNSNPQLDTYETLKDRADAGRIKERAIEPSSSPMPPLDSKNGALTAAQKELISCWLTNGKKQ